MLGPIPLTTCATLPSPSLVASSQYRFDPGGGSVAETGVPSGPGMTSAQGSAALKLAVTSESPVTV